MYAYRSETHLKTMCALLCFYESTNAEVTCNVYVYIFMYNISYESYIVDAA